MPTLSPSTGPGKTGSTLTLEDLREVLKESEQPVESDLDILERMANDMQGLVRLVLRNQPLLEKTGNPDELAHQLHVLEERYKDELDTIRGARSFEKKVEKQSWGRWALEKVKSVALFPVRHPVWSLFILAAIAAGVGWYYGALGDLFLKTIPNYSGKAGEVIKEGMQYMSDKLTNLGESVHSGDVVLPTTKPNVAPYVPEDIPGFLGSPTTPTPSIPTVVPGTDPFADIADALKGVQSSVPTPVPPMPDLPASAPNFDLNFPK